MTAQRTLVIAPHPDDEILGCGGTLLRRKSEGAEVGWLIVTAMPESAGWPSTRIAQREREVEAVAKMVQFDRVDNLRLPATQLDRLPLADVITRFAAVFQSFQPTEVLLPHRSDVHTDHRIVFDAAVSCCKWFRYPFVQRVLAYETMSETDFGLEPSAAFHPNYFVDISNFLDRKLEIMTLYRSELDAFPFPRSLDALRALSAVRGAAAGFRAAEAFQLLRERL